jgi:hypothetical protein
VVGKIAQTIVDDTFGAKYLADISPCPFTDKEIAELEKTGEMLVYVPAGLSASELCKMFDIKPNVNFEAEKSMIRTVMVDESHWFITSASKVPELLGQSGKAARRIYEDEGLHGMDLRRYICFCAAFRAKYGSFPDQTYWTFLLSGGYDRSGVSVVGFDRDGNLSHHGWMRNFRAKFCGSRYAILAPRIEILPETQDLVRARRGASGARGGEEAGLDRS